MSIPLFNFEKNYLYCGIRNINSDYSANLDRNLIESLCHYWEYGNKTIVRHYPVANTGDYLGYIYNLCQPNVLCVDEYYNDSNIAALRCLFFQVPRDGKLYERDIYVYERHEIKKYLASSGLTKYKL